MGPHWNVVSCGISPEPLLLVSYHNVHTSVLKIEKKQIFSILISITHVHILTDCRLYVTFKFQNKSIKFTFGTNIKKI